MSYELDRTYLISLNVPAALEENIVDLLLAFEPAKGFSSYSVNAHDHDNAGYSLAEQVSGRQKKMRFQMEIAGQDIELLLKKLRLEFSGAGIHYWVMPVSDSGYI